LLFNSKATDSLKLLRVSIRVLAGATQMLPNHCLRTKAMNSLNLLEVSKLLLFVYWQLQSKCFQVLASQLKSNEFLTPLKLSIRVLAGAIRMLPNHCFSMEKQWIPWSFSKFLFV
jgi:hypothetical protein